jgi:hypothetical protein
MGQDIDLIYAGILAMVSIPAFLLVALVPTHLAPDPQLPSNFATLMRMGIAMVYGALGALGGFWIYFFNTKFVKGQFRGELPFMEEGVASGIGQQIRPLSITIIGWFLIFGSVVGPFVLVFNRSIFPEMKFPMFFMGAFFIGRSAIVVLGVWMAIQLVVAVGLLRMKKWGLFATIGLQCVGIANCLLLLLPANRVRFKQIFETLLVSTKSHTPYPMPSGFPMWIGFLSSLPIYFVILWFLVKERQAFTSNHSQLVRLGS